MYIQYNHCTRMKANQEQPILETNDQYELDLNKLPLHTIFFIRKITYTKLYHNEKALT